MSIRREVWKLGGSVLRNTADYHHFSEQLLLRSADPALDRLYVVVSAAKGVSDSLIDALPVTADELKLIRARLNGEEERSSFSLSITESDIAALLLWGEIDSCHLLRSALLKRGGRARTVTQLDYYPIIAQGPHLHAEVDLQASAERFKTFDATCRGRNIVIVAGFGAVDRQGEPVLLGRNSSDYVAALLTRLDRRIERALFIKDSGGLFAEFDTPGRRLIDSIDANRFTTHDNGALLDRRCLNVINCDFRIVGSDLSAGTLVRCRSRRAAS